MNTQEAYEAIRAWFMRPEAEFAGILLDDDDGLDRLGASFRCVYRGGGDPASELRCGVGCLIPDDLYRTDFENRNAGEVLNMSPDLAQIFADVPRKFFMDVQHAHDGLAAKHIDPNEEGDADVSDFIEALDGIALGAGLTLA